MDRQFLGTSCGESDVGVVTAALQAFIGENVALRQCVLETERELREALKQRLVREFDAQKVQKNCGYQVLLRLTSEFDVIG